MEWLHSQSFLSISIFDCLHSIQHPRRFRGDHMVTTGKKIVVILRNPGKSEAVDLEEFWNVK